MTDPYKVLGVSPNATDDEIKKAYKALAKKYHPDKYRDSDLADLASQKMSEVNAAYDEIQKMRKEEKSRRKSGSSSSSYSGGSSDFSLIRSYLASGRNYDAEQALLQYSESERVAEWQFLYGCVLLRKGQSIEAQFYFDKACSMDPYNQEYRSAREQLNRRANNYGGGYNTQQSGGGCSGCDVCSSLLCADCCCECMGGDLIRCC